MLLISSNPTYWVYTDEESGEWIGVKRNPSALHCFPKSKYINGKMLVNITPDTGKRLFAGELSGLQIWQNNL